MPLELHRQRSFLEVASSFHDDTLSSFCRAISLLEVLCENWSVASDRNFYSLLEDVLTSSPQLEPYFSRVRFSPAQKKSWFRDREGLLFGFGVGFYIFLRIPLLGVLIYGIAEASTAYLITKITDPPPAPAYSETFAASQVKWTNKHEFLRLPLANLDAHNASINEAQQEGPGKPGMEGLGKTFS